MADPLRRLNSARAFPSEIEDAVLRIAEVRRAFLKNNLFVSQQPLRSTIRESWQRCATLIEPGRVLVQIAVASDGELQNLRLRNEPFLRAARPVVRRLTELVSGSGYTIGLADEKGYLLQVSGDLPALRRVERIGLTPGGDWSEASAGTNGIGTAIASGHAVTVIGPEHFCDGWQDYTCITVPIRNPWGGEIAGVLDISGDYHLVRPFFTGILAASALEIKENLKDLFAQRADLMPPFQIVIPGKPGGAVNERIDKWIMAPGRAGWFQPSKKIFRHTSMLKRRAFFADRLAIAAGTVSASLDIETTLSQVAEQAAHLLGLDSAAVCLLNELGKVAFLRAWSRPPSHSSDLFEAVKTLVEHSETVKLLRESGEPVAIDDVRAAYQLPANVVEQHGVRALALLPLLNASGVNGLIAVSRPVPYQWRPDDLRLELTFAFHAATAIENARLFQTLQQQHRHVETLNAVNQLLHLTFDPAQQPDFIIERIVGIMGLDGGMILLNQSPYNRLSLAAQAGLPEAILDDLAKIAIENSARRDSVLFCQKKLPKDPIAEKLDRLGLYSIIITPLVAGADLLGVLLLGSQKHRELTPESLTLFTNIGQQLGLALKNAQLLRSEGEAQALREADRIKSRFLMMVSHDLRSPLTAIRTSAESLLDQSGKSIAQSQEPLLRNIVSQSKRLGRMVDQLLDLTRIEAGGLVLDRDWTELGALIVDTVAKFERLNAPCQVKQCLATDLPLVYIDPERIVQVLWNLLENAHKYAPPDKQISVEAFSNSSEIFISVADRGPGIPVEDHDKIFQYFYRLPREQQLHTPGSGLGLAICLGIINAHGGRIWVEDRPGGGSVFSIALPYSSSDPEDLTGSEAGEPSGLLHSQESLSISKLIAE
jgi:two-component system sensor histidine kinase KdpD